MKSLHILLLTLAVWCFIIETESKQNSKSNAIENIVDYKDLKKLFRTKTNVLVCFISSQKAAGNIVRVVRETADAVKGQGTLVIVDCSGEAKKLCKKLKVTPEPYFIKHYKDGEFHKDYDRKGTTGSMINFMRDPSGDIPWEEDDSSKDVLHLQNPEELAKFLQKETKPVMVVFYAPWCGYCKQLKPEYAAAASDLKGTAVLAAIDVNRPENAIIRTKFEISGFPTIMYFKDGEYKFTYEGDNKRDALVQFMKDPTAKPKKPVEEDWAATVNDVNHLTTDNFDEFIKREPSTLIMFYAPWCGHCKKMKPQYEKAATEMKASQINGALAAVDATKNSELAKRFGVKGYPTVKYFKDGEVQWDLPALREADKIVEFMKDPKAPPPPEPPEPAWEDQPSEVIHLNTENFKTVLKKKRHALVMFYAPWCGHCKMAKPEFTAAAETTKENSRLTYAAVDCTKHSSVCSAVGVSGYPTFKYYNYYVKGTQDYSGGRKKNDFINFMSKMDYSTSPKATTPVTKKPTSEKTKAETPAPTSSVVQLASDTFGRLTKKGNIFVMFHKTDCDTCAKVKPQFEAAAKELAKNPSIVFGTLDCSKYALEICKAASKFPHFKYYTDDALPVDYNGEVTKDDLVNFVIKNTKNPLADVDMKITTPKPLIPPSLWDGVPGSELVIRVTDLNYERLLLQHKSLVILFYADWCSSCKAVVKFYGQAAKSIPSVHGVLATCDGSSNPAITDHFEIRTFPSIKYFYKGKFLQNVKMNSPTDMIEFMKNPPIKKDEL